MISGGSISCAAASDGAGAGAIGRSRARRPSGVFLGLAITLALVPPLLSCNGRILFDPDGCDEDRECGLSNLFCDVAAHACVACLTDAHCAALETGLGRCDAALHRCVACGLDADCGTGGACRGGRCVTPCEFWEREDEKCPAATPHCEVSVGFCVLCDADNDACAVASAPGPICNQAAGLCVSCLSDANCGGTNPRCDTITGRCVECLGSGQCGSGRVCDPATARCRSRP